jgi:hypothetical protein
MPAADRKPQTLYDKVFEDHIVNEQDDGTILLYIGTHILVRLLKISKKLTPKFADRHLVHEVTSPVRVLLPFLATVMLIVISKLLRDSRMLVEESAGRTALWSLWTM